MVNLLSIFKKYLNGEYPLVKTFWFGLMFVYITELLTIPFGLIGTWATDILPIKHIAGAFFVIFGYSYYPLAVIFPFAVYKSSKNYTGKAVWKYLAIIYSSLLGISAAYVFIFAECLGQNWSHPASSFIEKNL